MPESSTVSKSADNKSKNVVSSGGKEKEGYKTQDSKTQTKQEIPQTT